MRTHLIWVDNDDAIEFESSSESFNDVLDEFCAMLGYIDHADYCEEMELTVSPFNILDITP